MIFEDLTVNKKCGIYYIKNVVNSKVYVGQSVDIDQRMRQHLHKCYTNNSDNGHLYNAMRSYGIDNFEWDILELCDRSILNAKEAFWIKELDSTNREKGYNALSFDDRLNVVMPDDTKDKISKALNGKAKSEDHKANMTTKFGIDNIPSEEVIAKRAESLRRKNSTLGYIHPNIGNKAWNKGLSTSDEVKAKQRAAKLGKKLSSEHIANIVAGNTNRVLQFEISGKFLKLWDSVGDIEKESNGTLLRAGIAKCCRKSAPYYYDYIFRYERDIDDINNPKIDPEELSYIQKYKANAKVCTFKTRPTKNNVSFKI